MPISRYFSGHGSQVMSDMKDRYGEKKGKQVFYATANKKSQNPAGENENNKSSQANGAAAVERETADGGNGGRPSVTRRLMQNLRNRAG